ncbi:uncharacterized protein LOC144114619 [Amblyomma americanum]
MEVYGTMAFLLCATHSFLSHPQVRSSTSPNHTGTPVNSLNVVSTAPSPSKSFQAKAKPKYRTEDGERDQTPNASTSLMITLGERVNWRRRGRLINLFGSKKRDQKPSVTQAHPALSIWEKLRLPAEEPLYNASQTPFGWPNLWRWQAQDMVDQAVDDERHRRLFQVHHWMTAVPKGVALHQSPSDAETSGAKQGIQQQTSETSQHDVTHHSSSGLVEDFGPAVGTPAAPPCSEFNAVYCPYTEDYPIDVVIQVTKFLRWPLEKLFRDLRHLQSPPLADDGSAALACDTVTRIVRPGWAKNTDGRWFVVINTLYYEQFVTEISCRYENAPCNLVAPCFYATCQQRYNLQVLLVIDPTDPYKGPFLSRFLVPSCCVCSAPGGDAQRTAEDHTYRDEF